MPLAEEQMDQDIVICSEVNQREKYGIRYHLQWNLSIYTNKLLYKADSQTSNPKYLMLIKKVRESDELRLLH